MKVKELIDTLLKYPDNMVVVVDGYEVGFDNIVDMEIIDIYKRKNKSWWEGEYTKEDNLSDKSIKCVHLLSRVVK